MREIYPLSPRSTEPVATAAGIGAGESGMRVFLDPETGETLAEPASDVVFELDAEMAG